MRIRFCLFGFTLFSTPSLWAQQISGEGTCGKPESDPGNPYRRSPEPQLYGQ